MELLEFSNSLFASVLFILSFYFFAWTFLLWLGELVARSLLAFLLMNSNKPIANLTYSGIN